MVFKFATFKIEILKNSYLKINQFKIQKVENIVLFKTCN